MGKNPLVRRLENLLQELLRLDPDDDRLNDLVTRSAHLAHLFEQLETDSKDQVRSGSKDVLLREISRTANSFAPSNLISFMGRIPNSGDFGPNAGVSLQGALRKLGRYTTASGFLVRIARRLPIFKNIRVKGRSSSDWLTDSRLVADANASLTHALGRILPVETAQTTTQLLNNQVAAYYGKPIDWIEANFKDRLRQACTVHAEIQLVLHYEVHPVKVLPRMISSSKSACFLCNLFVSLHGTFCLPRTHGVLYDQWTLPHWTGNKTLAKIIVQINDALEEQIKSKLQQHRMSPFTHPNESVCLEPCPWTPSIQSSVQNLHPLTAKPSPAVEIRSSSLHEVVASTKGSSSSILAGLSLDIYLDHDAWLTDQP